MTFYKLHPEKWETQRLSKPMGEDNNNDNNNNNKQI